MNATQTKTRLKAYYHIAFLDETTDKMVSDWDNAEECSHCGHAIVYVCEMENGSILGRDCAFKTLGLTQRTIEEHAAAEAKLAKNRAGWGKTCREYAQPTAQEAVAACRKRNRDYSGHCWVGKFETGFYAVPANCAAQLFTALEIMEVK